MSGRALLKRIDRWLRPRCDVEGCDYPKVRWSSYCDGCIRRRAQETGRKMARERFERDVEVQVEALRRFHAERESEARS